VFVFFSFSDTKLPHYLVYGITPLFILMARHRDLLRNRWLAFAAAAAVHGCCWCCCRTCWG
jgi:4-amino-4-deoxy-L-arabinose transferase-like glycosyltransferase